ncbi:hypothetical protein QOT17_002610 [Balamuthia mandrillaris]
METKADIRFQKQLKAMKTELEAARDELKAELEAERNVCFSSFFDRPTFNLESLAFWSSGTGPCLPPVLIVE